MNPVEAWISIKGQRVVFAKDQSEYIPLPAVIPDANPNVVLTEWVLDDRERELAAKGGHIFLQQLTFGQPLQPVNLQISYEGEPPTIIGD